MHIRFLLRLFLLLFLSSSVLAKNAKQLYERKFTIGKDQISIEYDFASTKLKDLELRRNLLKLQHHFVEFLSEPNNPIKLPSSHLKIRLFETSKIWIPFVEKKWSHKNIIPGGLYFSQEQTIYTYMEKPSYLDNNILDITLHEYVHHLSWIAFEFSEMERDAKYQNLPVNDYWIVEGLGEYLSTVTLEGDNYMGSTKNYIHRTYAQNKERKMLHEIFTMTDETGKKDKPEEIIQNSDLYYYSPLVFRFFIQHQEKDALRRIIKKCLSGDLSYASDAQNLYQKLTKKFTSEAKLEQAFMAFVASEIITKK